MSLILLEKYLQFRRRRKNFLREIGGLCEPVPVVEKGERERISWLKKRLKCRKKGKAIFSQRELDSEAKEKSVYFSKYNRISRYLSLYILSTVLRIR